MRFTLTFIYCTAASSIAHVASGHGTPIHVEVDNNQLVVSGGLIDMDGFVSMIYAEDDEDGEFDTPTLPNVGPVVLWQLPGLEIFGMNEESSLSIEAIGRPAIESDPEERLLWYWDPQTELVESSAVEMYLLGTGQRFTTLSPTEVVAPPPFLLADPIAGEQGFHNHSLLAYALDNDSSPAAGVYGFFARLISDMHEPSDPFLLAFNHGVDYAEVFPAAIAINAAAADPLIPGDYNRDGEVTASDYDLWKLHFGEQVEPFLLADGNGDGSIDAADYTVWRDAFSQAPVGVGGAAVPEPATALLAAFGSVTAFLGYRRRKA